MLAQFDEMEGQILETGLWQSDTQAGDDEPARLTASILIVKVVNINTAIELLASSYIGEFTSRIYVLPEASGTFIWRRTSKTWRRISDGMFSYIGLWRPAQYKCALLRRTFPVHYGEN